MFSKVPNTRRLHIEMGKLNGINHVASIGTASPSKTHPPDAIDVWHVVLRLPRLTCTANKDSDPAVIDSGLSSAEISVHELVACVAFPKSYPMWPPHLWIRRPRLAVCSEEPPGLVSAEGGVNIVKLLRMESWSPSILMEKVVDELIGAFAQGRIIVADSCSSYTLTESEYSLLAYPTAL